MNTFFSATFVSLLLLFPSLAAQAQSNFVDVSSNAAEPAATIDASLRGIYDLHE